MDQIKIGSFLKALRREKGLTQEQLAERLNVSARTISRWETGSNMPDISLLIEIAEFYDVSIPEIVSGERKETPMNEETKEVARTMSQYAESEKEFIIKSVQAQSFVGVAALAVYAVLDLTGLSLSHDWLGHLSSLCLTLVFVMTLMSPLYATGLLFRLKNKRRLPSLPYPLRLLLAAGVGYGAAHLIRLLLSLLPL